MLGSGRKYPWPVKFTNRQNGHFLRTFPTSDRLPTILPVTQPRAHGQRPGQASWPGRRGVFSRWGHGISTRHGIVGAEPMPSRTFGSTTGIGAWSGGDLHRVPNPCGRGTATLHACRLRVKCFQYRALVQSCGPTPSESSCVHIYPTHIKLRTAGPINTYQVML